MGIGGSCYHTTKPKRGPVIHLTRAGDLAAALSLDAKLQAPHTAVKFFLITSQRYALGIGSSCYHTTKPKRGPVIHLTRAGDLAAALSLDTKLQAPHTAVKFLLITSQRYALGIGSSCYHTTKPKRGPVIHLTRQVLAVSWIVNTRFRGPLLSICLRL
jgi:hypothetical protein